MPRLRAVWSMLLQVPGWLRARGLGAWSPVVFLLFVLAGLLALAAVAPSLSPLVYVLF